MRATRRSLEHPSADVIGFSPWIIIRRLQDQSAALR
ncbi:MAG: hypothetical protein N838_21455 [Thiohalocapsa sp. PB-PSB1]|nr:MAG: hypothetical protein N838_21455 [Thiohalocapsa sp. PB-PSB1]